jgi:hypothetical protein
VTPVSGIATTTKVEVRPRRTAFVARHRRAVMSSVVALLHALGAGRVGLGQVADHAAL